MKRIAAYCRVSTDRQKDEQTIDVQKTFIKEWAEKNDAIIVKWYCDDGWSGDLLQRPKLDEMLEDAGTGVWEGIVFLDRDRIARNVAYQEFVFRELKDKNILLYCVTSPMPEDDEGNVMQQILAVFAEYERKKTARRMRQGKIHKAKSGKLVGHQAPYGYSYISKTTERDGYFVINEADAEIVKIIFHLVADQGFSMYRVIQELYAKKIPPPKKKSEYWRKSAIERLLNREDYIGTTYYNKGMAVIPKRPQKVEVYKKVKKSSRKLKPRDEWIPIPVPPIISKDLFERAHKRMRDNQLYNKRNKTYNYYLAGKVYCGCGSKRVGDGVNGHHYYRCAQRIYKFPLPNKCTYEGVNAQILDEMVWNKLLSLFNNPEIIKSELARWHKKQDRLKSSSNNELSMAKHALEVLKEEEDRYTQAFGSKLITFEKYKELMVDINAKRKAIEEQTKEVLEVVDEKIDLDDIDFVCKDVMEDLKTITEEKKQKYMRDMIKSIYVKERSQALVNGHIPLANQAQNIQYEPISRDVIRAVPSLEFMFTCVAPKPRYERIITKRDQFGRIVHSKPPSISI